MENVGIIFIKSSDLESTLRDMDPHNEILQNGI